MAHRELYRWHRRAFHPRALANFGTLVTKIVSHRGLHRWLQWARSLRTLVHVGAPFTRTVPALWDPPGASVCKHPPTPTQLSQRPCLIGSLTHDLIGRIRMRALAQCGTHLTRIMPHRELKYSSSKDVFVGAPHAHCAPWETNCGPNAGVNMCTLTHFGTLAHTHFCRGAGGCSACSAAGGLLQLISRGENRKDEGGRRERQRDG